jgi:WD40 repeat protein
LDGSVEDIAFSPHGKYLATASDDRTVRLWDPNSGDEVARMNHDDGVKMLAFGPHGKYLATVSGRLPMIRESGESFTAHIWHLSSGEELARMTHNNIINMVAFSPDGRYLATASDDQTARVWGVPSGEEVARVTHDDSVEDVAFSPDGRYLTTESSGTARARLWRQPEDLSKEACSRLTRNLTKEEWQQYMDGRPYHKTCTELPKPTV